MRILSFVLTGLAVLGLSTPAFAWDFTCSPKETKDLTEQTPNVLLMLDRSGSMDDADGIVNNTCRVCESSSGFLFEVASAADCPTGGAAWTRTASDSSSSPGTGYTWSLNIATPAATQDLTMVIDIRGDFDGVCEWGDVFADGTQVGRIDETNIDNNSSGCGNDTYFPFVFTVPASAAADGNVLVEVVTSPDNNDCDGAVGPGNCHVGSNCDGVDDCGDSSDNRIDVTLAHGNTYHGSVAWEDPCGSQDKWEQSKSAIDALTSQSDGASPPYAYFGLGLFHGSSATVHHSCDTPSNGPIMGTLNGTSPNGSTPTARAIQTSYQNECVNPPANITRTQSGNYPTDNTNAGWDLSFNFSNVPTADITVNVEVDGDFGSNCEFAAIYVDGVYFDHVGSSECGDDDITFTVPATFAVDGELDIFVDTRAQGDDTDLPLPNCNPGAGGVEAWCSGNNGATVSITHPNNSPRPGAMILINDGQPTVEIHGGSAEDDAIEEACAHRDIAPMFVVGLGAGTDQDYNNVLAAAGGTGSCDGGADPCDDPNNWELLDGLCTGAFQADSRDALLDALEAITADLVCTFNINFFNSGYTEVPADPANEYAYLAVEVYNTNTGEYESICNAEHPDIADMSAICLTDPSDPDCNCDDPVVGEGWEFTNSSNQYIQFTDAYCNNVRAYLYEEGTTQLACLCQETLGGACSVPDNVALGVCPEGNWICLEGVDICEPETDCCEAGAPCDTGLLGVCAPGEIVCNGPPLGTCVPLEDPSPEVCDNLDNDCDGEVDEELGGDACVVVGGIGRCGQGTLKCKNGMFECEPLGQQREVCNGLDDDCDGTVDNLNYSWSRPASEFPSDNPTRNTADNDSTAAACGFNDVCVCPNMASATYEGETWDEYITAFFPPVCQCGEGLAPMESTEVEPVAGESSTSEPAAACSTSGGASGGLASLFVLALVALRRRR